MKKRKIAAVISALVFIGLFCSSYLWVNNVLRHKVKEVDAISTFYEQPKDTVDLLLVGSSHAFLSMSPMELWIKEGISSVNLGTPAQTLSCSYYLIKEAIQRQHPKMIVLEVYGATFDKALPNVARVHMVTDCMPINRNKIEMVRELLAPNMSKSELFELLVPLFRYHSRWDSLKSEDFSFQKGYLRGYKANYEYRLQEVPPVKVADVEVSEAVETYFKRIVELCEDENISLIVSRIPMGDYNKYNERSGKMQTVLNMAEEMGIPVLDFELLREEIDLDYSRDFLDYQHMNAIGATKVTDYLAAYLAENSQLEDHRGEEKYSIWNEDAEKYQEMVEQGIKSLKEIKEAADDGEEDQQ